jgi:uncharacterized protein (DUF433 family)
MKTAAPTLDRKTQSARPAAGPTRPAARVELGRYIVADPLICHGKPTFKGTRIMVWQLFEHIALGEAPEDFLNHFPGRVSLEAVQEALELGRDFFAEPGQHWSRPPRAHE